MQEIWRWLNVVFIMDVRFEDFFKWLKCELREEKNFSTLGGRSKFTAKWVEEEINLIIKTSKGTKYSLKEKDIEVIFERWKNAEPGYKWQTSYYVDPIWKRCPHRIAAPYVPAIIKEWYYKKVIASLESSTSLEKSSESIKSIGVNSS